MKNILLDTNCYAAFFNGDIKVFDVLTSADNIWMSSVVLGELYAGFKGGTKWQENYLQLESFLTKPTVHLLDVSRETAEIFGELKFRLKQAGTPLPINDVWIGAHVMESGSVLISYDQHFTQVAGLRYWSYLQTN